MNDPKQERATISRRRWMGAASAPLIAAAVASALVTREAAAQAQDQAKSDVNLAGVRVFNVRDFGAQGDGKTLDTEAIQKAIDACGKDQGGTVLIPGGT